MLSWLGPGMQMACCNFVSGAVLAAAAAASAPGQLLLCPWVALPPLLLRYFIVLFFAVSCSPGAVDGWLCWPHHGGHTAWQPGMEDVMPWQRWACGIGVEQFLGCGCSKTILWTIHPNICAVRASRAWQLGCLSCSCVAGKRLGAGDALAVGCALLWVP